MVESLARYYIFEFWPLVFRKFLVFFCIHGNDGVV
jgi:hypothetical protein